jgi:hypothetical protein
MERTGIDPVTSGLQRKPEASPLLAGGRRFRALSGFPRWAGRRRSPPVATAAFHIRSRKLSHPQDAERRERNADERDDPPMRAGRRHGTYACDVSEPDTGASREGELQAFRRAAHALVDGVADHLAALPSRPVWQPPGRRTAANSSQPE